MPLTKLGQHIVAIIHSLAKILLSVGGAVLVVMMFLTGADVLLRYLFNRPITGAHELTEYMMLLLVFFGLAYTQMRRGHVSVDLIVSRFSRRTRAAFDSITSLISIVLLSLITWQIFVLATEDMARKHVTATLGVPIAPFIFVSAFTAAVFCLVLIVDFAYYLAEGAKK